MNPTLIPVVVMALAFDEALISSQSAETPTQVGTGINPNLIPAVILMLASDQAPGSGQWQQE